MVTTPMEITEALVSVGVPEARAQRIAHAVDRAENASTKEDVEHATSLMQSSVRELRLEMKLEFEERITGLEGRITILEGLITVLEGLTRRLDARVEGFEGRVAGVEKRMTDLGGRMTVLAGRMEVLEGRMERLEARLESLEQKLEAEGLRNEQRHRQLILALVGIGASGLVMLAGIGVTVLLRLFGVI